MNTLTLAEEGIFPIVFDGAGRALSTPPNTHLSVAGTIQGEGKLAGTSALFIRLSTCNLRCIWQTVYAIVSPCDTPHASFQIENPSTYTIDEIVSVVKNNKGNLKHIVISGGEPLLQAQPLAELCKSIKQELNLHITLETNGTLFVPEVFGYVDLLSISPKLSNSNPTEYKLAQLKLENKGAFKLHSQRRISIDELTNTLRFLALNNKDYQLKFVVSEPTDEVEIKELLKQLPIIDVSDILIMPLGNSQLLTAETSKVALEMVVRNGWRFSPRLHIDLFGSKSGV